MRGISDTVKHLIFINLIVFAGAFFLGNKDLFFEWFALYFPHNDLFRPWQLVTHMFMHGGFEHILFNMFALWMFGTTVERVMGQRKFLFFYLSCGLGAVFLSFVVYYFQVMPHLTDLQNAGFSDDLITKLMNLDIVRGDRSMVGASGAIMGVLVAFGMLFPEHKLMLIFLPIPIKAKYFIPAIIALDLFSALTGVSIFSPSNTAYVAHIGGAITGFVIMYFWKKNQFDKYRWN
ncbi:MAG: rhomboid family intramembrane serine protease [Bacteroidetes bacterium]|nr:rhomboid family intramembrane serine protease [Bacteroidota bacterium]